MNIVLIGHVCIDHNTSEGHSYKNWGSSLMYMGHYCQTYIKSKPVLVAPYGSDFKPYIDGLTLLPKAQDSATLIYENTVVNGVRTQISKHTLSAEPVELTSTIKGVLAAADIIAIAPLLPNFDAAYIREILSKRKPDSLCVLLAQGYFRRLKTDGRVIHREFEEALAILPLFDLIIFSEQDTPAALDKAKAWSQKIKGSIIVTQGPHGASAVSSGTVTAMPTQPISKAIYPVGCGDVFSMAAAYSYYQKKDIEAALKAGNSAARTMLLQTASSG